MALLFHCVYLEQMMFYPLYCLEFKRSGTYSRQSLGYHILALLKTLIMVKYFLNFLKHFWENFL